MTQFPPATPPPTPPRETAVHCAQCGQNLTGIAIGSTCPECGALVAPSFQGAGGATSGKAVASLVLGIVSIVVTPMGCMCVGITSVGGIVLGILAIVFGQLAIQEVRRGQANPGSRSAAMAGIICGVIGLVLGLAVVMLLGTLVALDAFADAGGGAWPLHGSRMA